MIGLMNHKFLRLQNVVLNLASEPNNDKGGGKRYTSKFLLNQLGQSIN
jgi:hypothetical protein